MQMISCKRLLGAVLVCVAVTAHGQSALQDSVRSIARLAQGTVGAVWKMAGDPSYEGINTTAHLPMQSVYKFHLACYFLHGVDERRFALDQPIPIDREDWQPRMWSPLHEQYPTPPPSLPLQELLAAIIVNSDNVACDILFRAAGGPAGVQAYVRGLEIDDIAIAATEAQMHRSWPVQYTNWTTPAAMVRLLEKFDAGRLLSPASTRLLFKWMSGSPRVAGRLRGLLPTGTPVAHKPGTSDVSPEGVAAATNDVGIITLPDGRHLILAVFVSDSRAADATRDWVIARIAQLVYRAYAFATP